MPLDVGPKVDTRAVSEKTLTARVAAALGMEGRCVSIPLQTLLTSLRGLVVAEDAFHKRCRNASCGRWWRYRGSRSIMLKFTKVIPQEQVKKCIVEQIVDLSAPQIMKELI